MKEIKKSNKVYKRLVLNTMKNMVLKSFHILCLFYFHCLEGMHGLTMGLFTIVVGISISLSK